MELITVAGIIVLGYCIAHIIGENSRCKRTARKAYSVYSDF